MEPPHLLLLVSKSTIGNREQLANQDMVATILESQGLTAQVLDGADPENRERRNELFGISGLRAKYPQLFAVRSKDEPPTFIGDFSTIQELNECGQLNKSFLLGISEGSTETSTDASRPKSSSRELPFTEDLTQSSTIISAQLLLLISNLSGNRQQDANQNQLLKLLQSKAFSKLTIQSSDGSDPEVKKRRDELFKISGLRAKYPQLFVVVETPKVSFLPLSWVGTKFTTYFLGDYDAVQTMEKDGKLAESNLFAEVARQQEESTKKMLAVGAQAALAAAVVVGIARLQKK